MESYPDNRQPDIEKANMQSVFLTSNFKLWVVAFIFFLTFFHLFTSLAFPNSRILPEKLVLTVVLGLIAYLWTQEIRDRERLQAMNEQLIIAHRKLQDAEVNTISSLVLFEEAKDPYIRGHSNRVTMFSLAMAEALELSASTKETIRRASMLHDLGKISIKDSILLKPGPLTDAEWDIVKRHPQIALDILDPLKFLYLEKRIILYHHERIDGKGYPAGLKDKEIPFESRIIAVADTFDAMNTARIYREPCSKEFILSELKKVSGTQLDSQFVDVFLGLIDKNPQFWERTLGTPEFPVS